MGERKEEEEDATHSNGLLNSTDLSLIVELQRLVRARTVRRRTLCHLSQKLCEECKTTSSVTEWPNNRRLLQYGVLLLHHRFALCPCPERKLLVALCELIARSMCNSAVMSVSFASLFLSTDFVHVASRTTAALISRIFDHVGHVDLTKVVDVRALSALIDVLDLFTGCSTDKWALLRDNAPVASILETLCVKITVPCATRENILALQKILFDGLKGTRQPLTDKCIDELFTVIVRLMRTAHIEADEACATFCQLLKAPTVTLALSKNTLQLIKAQYFFSDCILGLSSAQQQTELLSLGTFETLHLLANLVHLGNADKETVTMHLLQWANIVNVLLQKCVQKDGTQRSTNCWHHPLLGWTNERIDERDQVSFERLRLQLSRLWCSDMVRCLSDQFLSRVAPVSMTPSSSVPSSVDNQQKVPSTQETENSENSSNGVASSSSNLPLFQTLIRRLPIRSSSSANITSCNEFVVPLNNKTRHAWTSKSSRNSAKASTKPSTVPRVPFPPISPTVVLCQLYRSALLAFPNSESEILASLGRDDSLVLQHLWQFLDQHRRREEGGGTAASTVAGGDTRLRTYLGFLASDPEVLSAHFAPLQLFADITFTLISILDEREMYECERPFNRDQLRQIAKFVNLFCFHALWNELIDFEKNLPSKLFNSMFRLLQILYNRDCRRPFTGAPNFWTVDELSPKALISEFIGSAGYPSMAVPATPVTKRAHTLMDKMPHVIPLRDRIVLFRKLIGQDKENLDKSTTIITVERSRLIEDGYSQLADLSLSAMKGTVRVKFINQQGLDEAGIDQDGVFKEFLELTLRRVFDPNLNLFKSTSDKLLFPSATSTIHDNHLELFQFVGRMLAKALYEGICVDVQLAPVLLAAVLGRQLHPFDELATLDPVLYKNLTFLKHYSDSDDVADLELTFCAQDEFLGRVTTVELISGGRDIKVDNENKISYIHLMAHHRVVKQIRDQTKHFVLGFRALIQPKWVALFSTHELQHLISGKTSDIDLNDLRKHVQYYGGFHSGHRLVKWLWAILEQDFSTEERRLFLKFVTSCSRPPLLGFAYLEPCFSIRCIETSDDLDQGDTLGSVIRGFLGINKRSKQPINDRLPTASTCFNLLKLPNYTKRSVLLDKLRYAIHSETGFELS